MKKVLFSLVAILLLSVCSIAQTTYTMVSSASQLEPGQYILVGYDNDGNAFAMSLQKSNNRHAVAIEEVGGAITATLATSAADSLTFEFTLDGAAGAWTIFDPLNNGYLCAPGGGNYLRTQSALDDKGQWTINDGEDGGMFPVSNGDVEQCYMRYNISSTLFGCYKESSSVAAPVYFFKAGGDPATPDPEPSNYPTNLTTLVDGVDVTLYWNDAMGDQLPAKYLVLASTGDITVPTDGEQVANSQLAMNVNYGVETVTFSGLQGNTTYKFAIFPYTNSGSNIDYLTAGDYPVAVATTENIEFLLFEDFNEELGVFTAYDVIGEQSWHQGAYQGTTYANMNGYANGAANENEDWLIGPAIEIGANEYEEIDFEFRTAMKFEGEPLRVMFSMDYDGEGVPADFDWTDITDVFDFSSGDYTWVESGAFVMFIPVPGTYHFAFVYRSTLEGASSWEIDYVKLTGKQTVSVNENHVQSVSIYPNPAREQVSFVLDDDAEVSIFDMTGRMVSTMQCEAGQAQLSVSELVNGVYFVNFRYANGSTAVSKFVKF